MNWINLRTEQIRSPKFANANPGAIETWLRVLAYCCEQENGGQINDGCAWNDRTWMTTCGVTKAEITNAAPLIYDDGVAVFVDGFPSEKQAEIQRNREAGRRGGKAKTEAKTQAARVNGAKHNPSANPSTSQALKPSTKPTEGEGNGKEKRKDNRNRKEKGNNFPEALKVEGFEKTWNEFLEHRKQIKKPMTDLASQKILTSLSQRPSNAVAALDMAIRRGWQGFEWAWFDKDQSVNGNKNHPTQDEKPSRYAWEN